VVVVAFLTIRFWLEAVCKVNRNKAENKKTHRFIIVINLTAYSFSPIFCISRKRQEEVLACFGAGYREFQH
ncbi:MAG TPA: hypothetical protein PLV12_07270, partial [Saprospiraceae bacterium]|nr:hypothetical protein [Saprospiraceae bacterium]